MVTGLIFFLGGRVSLVPGPLGELGYLGVVYSQGLGYLGAKVSRG